MLERHPKRTNSPLLFKVAGCAGDVNDPSHQKAAVAAAVGAFGRLDILFNNSGIVGVYGTERNLRRLMGIPANDGRLIRPADEPSIAKRVFAWQESLGMALDRRVELRRQRWFRPYW